MSDNINPSIFLDAAIQECFNGKYLVSRVHFHIVTYVCKLMSFIRKRINRSISISIHVRIVSSKYGWFLLSKRIFRMLIHMWDSAESNNAIQGEMIDDQTFKYSISFHFLEIRSVAELLPSYLHICDCILEGDI